MLVYRFAVCARFRIETESSFAITTLFRRLRFSFLNELPITPLAHFC
jgi:hypothetical protein